MYMQNPFEIEVVEKDEYTIEDYLDIQQKLKAISIDELLNSMYPPKHAFYELYDFRNRCTRGIKQNMCDVENQLLPTKELHKIGNGGDRRSCIVCCTPFSHERSRDPQYNSRYVASQTIKESLESVGFNGYFYLRNGGFPTPKGIEMKYAGVPYCFKIFMMLEAKQMGFDKVVWIDSGCYAINNPQRLFDILEHQPTIMDCVKSHNNYDAMCFTPTIELLNHITGCDIHSAYYIGTIVFGLNMGNEQIGDIVNEYYDMVKLGLPFLSIFPEEIVLSAIFNKPEYKSLFFEQPECGKLQIHENRMDRESARNRGFYFYHRDYLRLI